MTRADFFAAVGFLLPLQFSFLSAALIRPFPTTVMRTAWGLKEQQQGDGAGLPKRECEMRAFAEFLRLS